MSERKIVDVEETKTETKKSGLNIDLSELKTIALLDVKSYSDYYDPLLGLNGVVNILPNNNKVITENNIVTIDKILLFLFFEL